MDSVVSQLAGKRVVFVGETHDRYDHHLNQLEIIRRLHQLDSNLAIGVEYFPRQSQPQVDDFIDGGSPNTNSCIQPSISASGATTIA